MENQNNTEEAATARIECDDLFCEHWEFETRGGEIWCRKGPLHKWEELFAPDAVELIERLISISQNAVITHAASDVKNQSGRGSALGG